MGLVGTQIIGLGTAASLEMSLGDHQESSLIQVWIQPENKLNVAE